MGKTQNEDFIKEYITPSHLENLNKYFADMKNNSQLSFPYIVSFRKAGKYSIFMLEAGAAAKPHSVLQKTIKDSTVTHGDDINQPLLKLLYGLAATREGEKITGLVLASDLEIKKSLPRGNKNLIEFIEDATGITKENLTKLQGMLKDEAGNTLSKEEKAKNKEYNEELIFRLMAEKGGIYDARKYAYKYYTGDYDIHDLLSKISQIAPIPSESDEEALAINDLNSIFRTGKRYEGTVRTVIKDRYNPVQHGPQYNYIAHMYNEEKGDKLEESVAKASLPVLMLNVKGGNAEWLEIKTLQELENYYTNNFAHMKYSWKDGFEKYIEDRQGKSFKQHMADTHA
ncbi:MAG: hypothetical protein J1D87_10320 [Lachnospiraceae bacterium]|nr:hypothetical protein [Lachnospiraceae bacterium]